MAEIPDDRRYATSHEWALKDGKIFVVGITEHAVKELGDLVFIDLPEVGTEVSAGDPFGEIESVKAVAELNAPISGTVTDVNTELEGNLDLLADSPYDEGWMIKIEPSDAEEIDSLLTASDYEDQLSE
ncbi:MAG: glycine cleavage system protein GcvH [Planctomycetota bacterium]